MSEYSEYLQSLRDPKACIEAIEWTGDQTLAEAWATCPHGDWMLWLAARVGVDRRLIVLVACDCAETVLDRVPAGEDRPRRAIETARRWAAGDATVDEVYAAAYAANAYASAIAIASCNAKAAAAAYASAAAYAAANAASAAADVYAAAASAADYAANAYAANAYAFAANAIVRARIPLEVIAAAVEQVTAEAAKEE